MNQSYHKILSQVMREVDMALRDLDTTQFDAFVAASSTSSAIFFAGAGRSGMMARAAAMRFMHLGMRSYVVGETTTPAIARGDLLVAASGSGTTAGVAAAAAKARDVGARVAAVTAESASPLAALADVVVVIPTRDAASAQPMGNLFEQSLLIFFDMAAMALMRLCGESESGMYSRHANLE